MAQKKRPQKKKRTNTLRIIGGKWRSRKLQIIDAPGMRPTPDRVRETLFNWLQTDIHGAHCLDLFAGSGALGLEALSRGANRLLFIEKNIAVAHQLKMNLQLLESKSDIQSSVTNIDALNYLSALSSAEQKPFDIIFLDPPYRKGLLELSLNLLKEKNLMDRNTLIYLEHESEDDFDWSSSGLKPLKETSSGQVKSLLAKTID